MERYDYRANVRQDIIDWLDTDGQDFKNEHADENGVWVSKDNLDEIADELCDRLWVEDSVTGNGSGSYTFSRYEAEENLCHNLDLLQEVAEEYGDTNILKRGPEVCDVSIRCWLLSECVWNVLNEIVS